MVALKAAVLEGSTDEQWHRVLLQFVWLVYGQSTTARLFSQMGPEPEQGRGG